jgi:hypothetical protein
MPVVAPVLQGGGAGGCLYSPHARAKCWTRDLSSRFDWFFGLLVVVGMPTTLEVSGTEFNRVQQHQARLFRLAFRGSAWAVIHDAIAVMNSFGFFKIIKKTAQKLTL